MRGNRALFQLVHTLALCVQLFFTLWDPSPDTLTSWYACLLDQPVISVIYAHSCLTNQSPDSQVADGFLKFLDQVFIKNIIWFKNLKNKYSRQEFQDAYQEMAYKKTSHTDELIKEYSTADQNPSPPEYLMYICQLSGAERKVAESIHALSSYDEQCTYMCYETE